MHCGPRPATSRRASGCTMTLGPDTGRQVRLLLADPGTAGGDADLRASCVRFLMDKTAPGLAATRMRVAFRRKYRTPGEPPQPGWCDVCCIVRSYTCRVGEGENCAKLQVRPPRSRPRAPRAGSRPSSPRC